MPFGDHPNFALLESLERELLVCENMLHQQALLALVREIRSHGAEVDWHNIYQQRFVDERRRKWLRTLDNARSNASSDMIPMMRDRDLTPLDRHRFVTVELSRDDAEFLIEAITNSWAEANRIAPAPVPEKAKGSLGGVAADLDRLADGLRSRGYESIYGIPVGSLLRASELLKVARPKKVKNPIIPRGSTRRLDIPKENLQQ